jgi:hypothetical protein
MMDIALSGGRWPSVSDRAPVPPCAVSAAGPTGAILSQKEFTRVICLSRNLGRNKKAKWGGKALWALSGRFLAPFG